MIEFFQSGWWQIFQTLMNFVCYYIWWRIGRMREAREVLPVMMAMHGVILSQQHALQCASAHIDNLNARLEEAQNGQG